MIPVDWQEDAVLWLVNRCVFHPRGFALARNPDNTEWHLIGDGSEPWRFSAPCELDDPAKAVDEDDAFRRVEALFARARSECASKDPQ